MKLLRIIGCFAFLVSGDAFAQKGGAANPLTDTFAANTNGGGNDSIVPGVIKVRKPKMTPYVKVEYNLYLSNVTQVKIPVTQFGSTAMKTVPVYDSLRYPENLERIYPVKSTLLSKYYSENMLYTYQQGDTASVDTMIVGMWIAKNGKIRYVEPDTSYTGGMPDLLVAELYAMSMNLEEWGTGGGYKTRKKFLKPSETVGESYYCEAYIIVSSAPLTKEQQDTGVTWAPFDIPLNSPARDDRHEQFLIRNSKSKQPNPK